VGAEFGLLRLQLFDREDGEDHVLDAEAGIDRIELCGEQPGEMARVAARPGGAEADMLDPAVDPVKAEIEAARADALARQPRRQILGQPFDRTSEIGRVGDWLGEAEPDTPARRLAQGRQRFRQIAKGLVEPTRNNIPKAAGQRVARHRVELADVPQPDPAQALHGFGVEPQRLDRQRRQGGALV
jgi:hypothetical protein